MATTLSRTSNTTPYSQYGGSYGYASAQQQATMGRSKGPSSLDASLSGLSSGRGNITNIPGVASVVGGQVRYDMRPSDIKGYLEGGSTSGGGGAAGGQYPLSVAPQTVPRPNAPAMPVYQAPEWDEGAIKSLTRKKAAPQYTKLREAVQAATSASRFENPNVQKMTLRSALAGYGEGIGDIAAGAESAAQSEYARQYATEQQESLVNYQANLQRTMQDWQNAMDIYNRASQNPTF
jgi:hypothetical protein